MLNYIAESEMRNAMPLSCTHSQDVNTEEQFICFMKDGWYVQNRRGEAGPFDSLREAEIFCSAESTN